MIGTAVKVSTLVLPFFPCSILSLTTVSISGASMMVTISYLPKVAYSARIFIPKLSASFLNSSLRLFDRDGSLIPFSVNVTSIITVSYKHIRAQET